MRENLSFDRDEAWRAFDRLATAIENLGAPYLPTLAALGLVQEARFTVLDEEAIWPCETCEGFVWTDDDQSASSDDCHHCGACVARMEAEGDFEEDPRDDR